jgi:lipopolysaccharide transport system ATP-binding protein
VTHHWIFSSQVDLGREAGVWILRCEIPKFRLYMGSYSVRTWLNERKGNTLLESLPEICNFEVSMLGTKREEYEWQSGACVYLEDSSWKVFHEA